MEKNNKTTMFSPNSKQTKYWQWQNRLRRLFPVSQWLPAYKLGDIRYDLIAGFTVGLTLVPQCMAYAQIANVKPEYGLYSSYIAQFVYAVMGTSKDASVGPTSIVAMVLTGMNANNPLIKQGDNTYNCMMSFFGGLILMLIGVLRLGFIVNLFSIPVVSGFTSAAGFVLFASQLKSFFGLTDGPNEAPCLFVKQIANVFIRYDEIKICDVAFGLSTIAFLVFAQYLPQMVQSILERQNEKKNPESRKLTKGQIIFMEYLRLASASRNVFVFVFTTLAAYLLCASDPSFESKITLVGYIEPGFPVPSFPKMEITAPIPAFTGIVSQQNASMEFDNYTTTPTHSPVEYIVLKSTTEILADMAVSLFIVPMMMMLEMFAITKALGRKNGYRVDATNELLAVGLGNFLQSFFQGMPSTVGVSRCALNDQCKVKSQLGSVVSACIVIVAIAALTGTFYYIPKAGLAGLLIAAAHNLVDVHIIQTMYREYWPDLIILVATFILCLFYDMAYGILFCLLLNMITFLRPVVRMQLNITREIHAVPGDDGQAKNKVTVVRLAHGMKYPSADKFLDRMSRILARGDKHVVLDCQFWSGIDYTGLQALRGILLAAYKQNKHIIFANLSDTLLKEVESIGLDHWQYVDSVDEAVEQYNNDDQISDIASAQPSAPASTTGGTVSGQDASQMKTKLPPPERIPSIQRVVSITRSRQNTMRSHANTVAVDVGLAPPPIISFSRQTSSSRRTSVSREADSVVTAVEGGRDEMRKRQDSIMKNLAKQAYFYQDIPITVGNLVEGPADEDSDPEDDVVVDFTNGDINLAPFKVVVSKDEDAEPNNGETSQKKPRSYSAILGTHEKISKRFSKISEHGEEQQADDDYFANSNPAATGNNPRRSSSAAAALRSPAPNKQKADDENANKSNEAKTTSQTDDVYEF